MKRARYRRPIFRGEWWVQRMRPLEPAGIEVSGDAEGDLLRAALHRADIPVLATHWTTAVASVTVRSCDRDAAVSVLESLRGIQV